MYDVISIGDTSHNIFLEMTDDTVHMHTAHRPETVQICFTYADKIPVHAFHETIGGNSSNAAAAFARLGFKTAFYTHIGNDAGGKSIVSDTKNEGISTDYIVTDPDKRSNFSTVINLHGERTILVYHEHRHYVLPKLAPAKWVYLSSMGEGFEKCFPDIIKYVKETGANLCYQPGTFQLKFGAERTKDLLKATKIFLVNKEEAELYLGVPKTSDMRSLLDGIRELGPEIVMISDGPQGAYATDGTQYLYMGIIKDAPRNEATGAGDSFSSAFIAALAHGKSLAEALRWGQCEASSVIQQIGAQAGLLKTRQMEHLLEMFPEMQAEEIGKPVDHPAEFVYSQPKHR